MELVEKAQLEQLELMEMVPMEGLVHGQLAYVGWMVRMEC